MNTSILDYLEANGLKISYRPTGAVMLLNGDLAFVRERITRGKMQIVVDHPPKGGRAEFSQQVFTSRERALKALLARRYKD